MDFRVEVNGDFIRGYVGKDTVIILNNFCGSWNVYQHKTLPIGVEKAAVYAACFKAVFDKLEEIK